jgi:DNA-binding transcriptional ArsR family regulator
MPARSSELVIDRLDQAAVLLKPLRIELLKLLAEPRTCPQLAEALGLTMQKAYYHVKVLEKAGLVAKVGSRPARGVQEGIYQATAGSYWLSPRIVAALGGSGKAREQVSLGLIQGMAEGLLEDVARLSRAPHEVAAAGLSARIELAPGRRAAFLAAAQAAVQALAEEYGLKDPAPAEAEAFKLLLAIYEEPQPTTEGGAA